MNYLDPDPEHFIWRLAEQTRMLRLNPTRIGQQDEQLIQLKMQQIDGYQTRIKMDYDVLCFITE